VSDDITTRLRRDCMSLIADEAADEIERLRKERDEARRSCCEFAAMVDSADTVVMYVDSNRFHEIAMRYMKSRGWDCFKEDGK
jgi:hypothetical protein